MNRTITLISTILRREAESLIQKGEVKQIEGLEPYLVIRYE